LRAARDAGFLTLDALQVIDYLRIATKGCALDIFRFFDFARHRQPVLNVSKLSSDHKKMVTLICALIRISACDDWVVGAKLSE